jgi:serine protease AprX
VTGQTYTGQYDIFTIGAGYLDVWAALNSYDVVPAGKTALSPTAIYDPASGKVTIVNGTSVVWGDSVWSTSLVWGTSVFVNGTSIVWGGSVVWGDITTAGFSVVWGGTIVWGTTSQTSAEDVSVAINGEN